MRTEALIAELRKEVEVEGRTRWITAEFTGITEAQIGRYKSIKNNLCPELMQAFKGNPFVISFDDLSKLVVTGVWNKEQRRLEF